jgi:hypothetical protein
MRERAAALGGTLEAGPRDGGGWRVQAWLPVSEPTTNGGDALGTSQSRGGELRR